MLAAYFDDSGTHNNSEFAVWGGVVGTQAEFGRLDEAWMAKLRNPLPGKPRLKKFSLSSCAAADGEFAYYTPAERDMIRYDMREIIKNSGVRPRAYVVPVRMYNKIIRGRVRKAYGPPDGFAFAACADRALAIAKANQMPLVCTFDKGQERDWLNILLREADERAAELRVTISYGFAAVIDSCGLQAADTIATEHYWYSLECLKANPPKITPHFQSLIDMTNPDASVLLEPDLRKMRADFLKQFPLRKWLLSRVARRAE